MVDAEKFTGGWTPKRRRHGIAVLAHRETVVTEMVRILNQRRGAPRPDDRLDVSVDRVVVMSANQIALNGQTGLPLVPSSYSERSPVRDNRCGAAKPGQNGW